MFAPSWRVFLWVFKVVLLSLLRACVGLPCGFTNCLLSLLTFSLNIANFEALEGFARVRLKPTPGLNARYGIDATASSRLPSNDEVRKKVIRDDCNRYLG